MMHRIDPVDTLGTVNLTNLDLNLLITLDALLEQRSVSKAAEQIGLSQPAVSAQLPGSAGISATICWQDSEIITG